MNNKRESEEIVRIKRGLAFQRIEIETQAAELVLSKKELVFQNEEKKAGG